MTNFLIFILKAIISLSAILLITPIFLFFLFLRKVFERIEDFSRFIHWSIEKHILSKTTPCFDKLAEWIKK